MAHSKYYRQYHGKKEGNIIRKIGVKRLIIIAALLLFTGGSVIYKAAEEVKIVKKAGDKEYGSIINADIDSLRYDEDGDLIRTDRKVTVEVIDVGEGLSVFIKSGSFEVLIDGGTAEKTDAVYRVLNGSVSGELDYVINTHPHAEHYGGLTGLYDKVRVKNTIYGAKSRDKDFKEFLKKAGKAPGSKVFKGKNMNISLGSGVILCLFDRACTDSFDDDNKSLICLLKYNGEDVLLVTGDAQKKETEKLKGIVESKVRLYVAGAHGGEFANTPEFLSMIDPEIIVIPSLAPGKSGANLPAPRFLKTIAERGYEAYGTYKGGNFVMTIRGGDVTVNRQSEQQVGPSERAEPSL